MMQKSYCLLAACALIAFASPQMPPAGWPAVVEGYRAALQKIGIVGSSLMIARDGRIAALGLDYEDVHGDRDHAAARSRAALAGRSGGQVRRVPSTTSS